MTSEADTREVDPSGLTPAQRALLHARLARRSDGVNEATRIRRRDDTAPPVVSVAQRSLLLIDEVAGGTNAYNVAQAMRVRGPLDLTALQLALDELLRRHQVLRTRYLKGGLAELRAAHQVALDLAPVAENDIAAFVGQAVSEPFDLASGSLLRASVGVIADDDHVIVLVVHHIASDAVSKQILNSELSTLYRAFSEGLPSPLDEPDLQYADYAAWMADRSATTTDLEWWVDALAGAPEQIDLPYDRPRPPRPTFRGAHLVGHIDAETVERMRRFGVEHRATTYMVLLAAYCALLERYTGAGDMVVGSTVSGRHNEELQKVVGLFLDTLPIRVDTSADPDFTTMVARCREATVATMRHQSVPLGAIVDAVKPARSSGRHPLFQTVITHRPGRSGVPAFADLDVTALPYEGGWSKFDLSVISYPAGDAMRVLWEYNTDLFDADTITALASQFTAMLEAALLEPGRPISALRLTTPADEALLAAWNDTAADAPVTCVHEMIAEQVRLTPDAPAVGDDSGWLTYAELDRRANALAHHLIGLGVEPDSRVAVCMTRSVQLEVALLAVLKAGGAYVPLDPDYPADRLRFMLEDCSATALLTEGDLGDDLSGLTRTIHVDRLDTSAGPTSAPRTSVAPSNLATVFYTSGSTGRPKGVMVEHRNLTNQLWRTQEYFRLGPDDTVLQRTPYSFDVSCWELLLSPITGARLFMAQSGRHGDPWYLADVIETHHVTFINFVPSMLRAFLESGVTDRCQSLRFVIAIGEALPDDVKDQCLRLLPHAQLENAYGPTEAAVTVTSEACAIDRRVTIGTPMANCQALVLDEHGQQVPPGMPGELWLGGAQLARGYLDRPELTAERFVETEFGRLYRTGDRSVWRLDGRLQYLGRLDDQVKLRGFRIELAEIESVLGADERVEAACCVVRPAGPTDDLLVAYVVPVQGWSSEGSAEADLVDALLTRARTSLPDYMVPQVISLIPALPLSPAGKLDRRALASLEVRVVEREHVEPATATERVLERIWREELHLTEPISTDVSFFDVGGSSLVALRVFPRIEKELRTKLALSILFERITIASLARTIDLERDNQDPWDTVVTIQPDGDRTPVWAFPALRGSAVVFRQMADFFDHSRPVHAVESPGLDGRRAPHTSIEATAADAIRAITKVQPKGPYHLLGFCFGGTTAYEVGTQLRARGEEVTFVGTINSSPYGRGGGKVAAHMRSRQSHSWRWWRDHLVERLSTYRSVYLAKAIARTGRSIPPELVDVQAANRLAARRYVTPDSDLHVTLYEVSSGRRERGEARRRRWELVAHGGCDVHVLEGEASDHVDLVKGDLARQIAEAVNTALADEP